MSFIEKIKEKARKDIKTIILPEATDERILQATEMVKKEKYAKIILLGKKEEIRQIAQEKEIDINGTQIIDPEKSE